MRTWEDLKNDPSTFTNMSKEEETLIDTSRAWSKNWINATSNCTP